MAKRRFVSNHYHGFSVRQHYFTSNPGGRGCYFETDDPDVIKLIESLGDYGTHIFPAETPEEIEAMKRKDEARAAIGSPKKKAVAVATVEEEQPPIAHQGARGTTAGKDLRKGDMTTKG